MQHGSQYGSTLPLPPNSAGSQLTYHIQRIGVCIRDFLYIRTFSPYGSTPLCRSARTLGNASAARYPLNLYDITHCSKFNVILVSQSSPLWNWLRKYPKRIYIYLGAWGNKHVDSVVDIVPPLSYIMCRSYSDQIPSPFKQILFQPSTVFHHSPSTPRSPSSGLQRYHTRLVRCLKYR